MGADPPELWDPWAEPCVLEGREAGMSPAAQNQKAKPSQTI